MDLLSRPLRHPTCLSVYLCLSLFTLFGHSVRASMVRAMRCRRDIIDIIQIYFSAKCCLRVRLSAYPSGGFFGISPGHKGCQRNMGQHQVVTCFPQEFIAHQSSFLRDSPVDVAKGVDLIWGILRPGPCYIHIMHIESSIAFLLVWYGAVALLEPVSGGVVK